MNVVHRTAFAVLVFALAGMPGAIAKTYTSHTDIENEGPFGRYLNADAQVEARGKMVIAEDTRTEVICDGAHSTLLIQVRIIEPVEMGEDDAHPTAGNWTERYLVSRCGVNTVYNAIYIASPDGVTFRPVAPGTTRLGLNLVRDLRPEVERQAVIEGCSSRVLVDTAVGRPADYEPENSGGVYETWTVWGCGRSKDLVLAIEPQEDDTVKVRVEHQQFRTQ